MTKEDFSDWTKAEYIKEIKKLRKRKKYGIVWKDKPEEVVELCKEKLPVLKEMKNKEIIADENSPINILIEGDNYHALSVLNYTHKGKIDIIYIDPPYNTGSENFIYNDNRYVTVQEDDPYKHSKWLSFIRRRLMLTKNLLSSKGLIYISIDDNEFAQLKLLCDEVFGEKNFVTTLIWKKRYGGGAKTKYFVGVHEYILCYAKNKESIGKIETDYEEKNRKYYKFQDEKFEVRGPYRLQPLATRSMDARPNLRYPIIYDGKEIWPEKQWQWSKERVEKAIKNDLIVIKERKGKFSVDFKQYLKDRHGKERKGKPFSIIEGIYTQHGTLEIKNMFGDGQKFSFPKPSSLIKKLIKIQVSNRKKSSKDLTVLDFFAGSGTTGNAVLELNKEDNGHRNSFFAQTMKGIFVQMFAILELKK